MISPDDLRNRAVLPDEDAPRLTPSDLAQYWNVHPNTVYREIRKGALRAFRIGRQLRIRRSDADRYGRPLE